MNGKCATHTHTYTHNRRFSLNKEIFPFVPIRIKGLHADGNTRLSLTQKLMSTGLGGWQREVRSQWAPKAELVCTQRL